MVFATPCGEEFCLAFQGDFFERFESIGRESGAQDVDAGEFLFSEFNQGGRGVGL